MALAAGLLHLVPAASVAPSAVAGLAAGAADSLLGATIQARYRCPACGGTGESPRHACGAGARLAGGWRWVTNDTVNFAATLVGAAVAVLPGLVGVILPPSP